MWKQLVTRGSLFEGVQQQDAYEFMQHTLKKIKEHQRRAGGSDLTAPFVFDAEQRVQCTRCQGCRYIPERGVEVLALGIPTELAQPPIGPSPKGEVREERQIIVVISFSRFRLRRSG